MIDTKNAFFVHYPFAGGYYEQPYHTMEILNLILSEYRSFIAEKMKSI